MAVCSVKFKDTGKAYYFKYEDLILKKNLTVVVDTEKGEQFAKVVEPNVDNTKNVDIDKMKNVLRISTKKDYNNYLNNLRTAKEVVVFAREVSNRLGLDMRIMDANFTLDKKQLIINFVADERIDFRDLVKELAFKYKTRIELHQIGVRDKAREVSGIGCCGRELCCASFLNNIDTISINMAKNQNIALNPNKINGACGRLLCCLSYENDVYECHRKLLPKVGEVVKCKDGEGKVVSLDILRKKYTVQIGEEKFEYDVDRT
jgi:cell fate regulator YaaT (PSP1 superfamily)